LRIYPYNDNKTINTMRILEKYTDEQLKKELESRGFYTKNLWTVHDVQIQLDDFNKSNNRKEMLSNSDKQEILDSVISSDYIKSHINGEIFQSIENNF
jgi:hypothetical protein